MKLDVSTMCLYDDDGVLLKRLHCPKRIGPDGLTSGERAEVLTCSSCEREVLDTALFDTRELAAILRRRPDTCVMISDRQPNIAIIGVPERK